MYTKTILTLLLVSGAFITPAYANYFHNPYTGINLNIGSAPNPTPQDIREDRLPAVVQDDTNPSTAASADAPKESDKTARPAVEQDTASQGSSPTIQTASQSR